MANPQRFWCVIALVWVCMGSAHSDERPEEVLVRLQEEGFRIDPQKPAQKLFIRHVADLKKYKSVLLMPLIFLPGFADKSSVILKQGEADGMIQYFQESLQKALVSEHFDVATEAGPGVVRLTVTVADVLQEQPKRKFYDYLPLKATFNLARLVMGKQPYLLKVTVMGQMEDCETNDLIGEVVNILVPSKTKTQKASVDLAWIKDSIDLWNTETALQLAKHIGVLTPN